MERGEWASATSTVATGGDKGGTLPGYSAGELRYPSRGEPPVERAERACD